MHFYSFTAWVFSDWIHFTKRNFASPSTIILSGDIYPLDVISHLPILLEENGIPYIFVPSKQELGAAACTKRPTSVVLVRDPKSVSGKKDFDGMDLYNGLMDEAKAFDPSSV